MIRMKFTFLVFQEGQPEEQVQTIVEFKNPTELALEMMHLAAHNSIVFTHPMISRIPQPGKIISRVRTRQGIRAGTSIVIMDAQELVEHVPPELASNPEILFHFAAARLHKNKLTN